MKLILFIYLFSISSVIAYDKLTDDKYALARVEKENDIYIFYKSKPIENYDIIGTYKVGLIMDNTPKLLLKKILKKVSENYPSGQGIILNDNLDKCEVIKFK